MLEYIKSYNEIDIYVDTPEEGITRYPYSLKYYGETIGSYAYFMNALRDAKDPPQALRRKMKKIAKLFMAPPGE